MKIEEWNILRNTKFRSNFTLYVMSVTWHGHFKWLANKIKYLKNTSIWKCIAPQSTVVNYKVRKLFTLYLKRGTLGCIVSQMGNAPRHPTHFDYFKYACSWCWLCSDWHALTNYNVRRTNGKAEDGNHSEDFSIRPERPIHSQRLHYYLRLINYSSNVTQPPATV